MDVRPCTPGWVTTASGDQYPYTRQGTGYVQGTQGIIKLTEVKLVDKFEFNLISLPRISKGGAVIVIKDANMTISMGPRIIMSFRQMHDGLFRTKILPKPTPRVAPASTNPAPPWPKPDEELRQMAHTAGTQSQTQQHPVDREEAKYADECTVPEPDQEAWQMAHAASTQVQQHPDDREEAMFRGAEIREYRKHILNKTWGDPESSTVIRKRLGIAPVQIAWAPRN
jgi:hypothetical protein